MKTLSIIIPCYNEAQNIPLLLQRFALVLTEKKLLDDITVILVNNGSIDNTSDILKAELEKYLFASTITVPVNQGYGYGILQGLRVAKTPFIGWTHADMQTDPSDIVRAYELLKENNNDPALYLKGKRIQRSWFDSIFTFGMSVFESMYLKKFLWDINAQPNILHRSFFGTWDNPPHDFALDLYALYQARVQGLKIIRFKVKFPPRIFGTSSWNTGMQARIKLIKRTMAFSKQLKRKLST